MVSSIFGRHMIATRDANLSDRCTPDLGRISSRARNKLVCGYVSANYSDQATFHGTCRNSKYLLFHKALFK